MSQISQASVVLMSASAVEPLATDQSFDIPRGAKADAASACYCPS